MGINRLGFMVLPLVLAGMVIISPAVRAADAVVEDLNTAREAYEKGNLALALQRAESGLATLVDRLGKALLPALPAVLPGWTAEPAEILGLGQVGGGLSISRVYTKGNATLNVTLILDNQDADTVEVITPDQPNTTTIKVGDTEGLLRFDTTLRSGEAMIALTPRLRLEIQGDDLDNPEPLRAASKGWNIPMIRKIVGN